MSVISNTHSVLPFVSGTSKPLNGQRLAKVGYKSSKSQPAKFPSVCASIPVLEGEEILGQVDALIPHFRSFLEGVQDQIFRAAYEGKNGELGELRQEEISVAACVSFLAAEASGSRISGEAIKNWFMGGLAKDLSVAIIMDALGYGSEPSELSEEQEATVLKHVGVYCEVFQLLAGKNLTRQNFSEKQWNRLSQILELVVAEDPADTFAPRLVEKMQVIAKSVSAAELI